MLIDFDTETNSHDLAMILTDVDIIFSDTVQPACLPESPVQQDQSCIISGWGDLEGMSYHIEQVIECESATLLKYPMYHWRIEGGARGPCPPPP